MRTLLLPVLATSVALILLGCGKSAPDVTGHWTVTDVKLPDAVAKMPTANLVTTALKSTSYDFAGDHNYKQATVAGGQTLTGSGTWKAVEGGVEMTPTVANGQSIADLKKQLQANPVTAKMAEAVGRPQTLKFGPDGKTLVITSKNGASEVTITLGKQ